MSAAIWYDGPDDYRQPVISGPRRIEYPFQRDRSAYILEQDYLQRRDHYERGALDTPHPDEASAYLVHESAPRHFGGDVVQFTRIYATIPEPRTDYESYVYTVPGITVTEAKQQKIVDSVAYNGDGTMTINTTTAHGLSVSDEVFVTFWVQDPVTLISYHRTVFRVVATVPDTDTFTTTVIVDIGAITWDSVFERFVNRDPYQRVVQSYLRADYFLPGVSLEIATPEDIPVIEADTIIDGSGNETNSYAGDSTPTVTEYRALVQAGTLIVAESSIIRPWMGNIYERVTRYVRAV